MTMTNSLGYYSFDQAAAGGAYTFKVNHRRYKFEAQVFTVNGGFNDLNFTALV
jgi:hypothetical protein